MLQLVTSIASQTFNKDADAQLARKSFSERLSALARSNYVVSRGGWTSTRFADLVEEALKPFGSRISTEGRDILLAPELCFDMGLVLHELATNSMKYGTLGRDHGAISVKWFFRPRSDGAKLFCFDWDDPLSTADTTAKGDGFGSKLVSALIEQKWNGVVTVHHASRFRITLEVPVAL